MKEDPDRLFRRYRRARNVDDLARVFDLTVTRLLRLAVHLRGEAAEAEDLVQATYLAAIEKVDEFDESQECLPWLLGILSNKARMMRRSSERKIDPERLFERAAGDPLEDAEQAEFSGELAKALDRLDEPTRRILTLRLRHGMKSPDIAHLLEVSPGTVRVQIHRGLEKLRRILPAGFGASALLLVPATRGLEAIRTAVLAKAETAGITGTASITLGGVLMTKKMLAAAAGVVALLAALIVRGGFAGSATPSNSVAQPTSGGELTVLQDGEPLASAERPTESPTLLARSALPSPRPFR